MIRIWKGYHSPQLLPLIQECWEKEDLLILCPPLLKDFGFVDLLPPGEVAFCGDWDPFPSEIKAEIKNRIVTRRSHSHYPENPVLGVFTSGTISGAPRLVLYSKINIETNLAAILELYDRSRIEAIYCYPQPFHTFGLLLGYLMCALYGFRLITDSGKYTSDFHESRIQLETQRLLTLGTPTHFQDLIQYLMQNQRKIGPSYSCIMGGAPVPVSLWMSVREQLRIEAPSIGYGATEASPGITHHPPGRVPREDGEIGFPFRHLRVNLDETFGIEFSGPSVCLAMIQNEQIVFPQSIWIRDRILMREDGMFLYRGRLDLILNRGGEKFSLEEMERSIKNSMGIESLCVITPQARLGEDLGILVKKTKDQDLEIQRSKIQNFLKEVYGINFELKHFCQVDEIPINSASKMDRKVALELLQSQNH